MHRAALTLASGPCTIIGLSFGADRNAMRWCRSIPGFVRVLIALFLVAQFSGVVSSPRASTPAPADAAAIHHQHAHDHGSATASHDHGGPSGAAHHHGGDPADTCCALHAYFAGILPPVIAIASGDVVGEELAAGRDDFGLGVPPGRLDRPPRPLR
jgi:hypothetical protein